MNADPNAADSIRQLESLWRDALGGIDADLDDNFFDLGGTSLQMIRLHAQLRQQLRPDITVLDLFRHPTLRSLSSWLRETADAAPQMSQPVAPPPDIQMRAQRRHALLASRRR